MKNTDNKSVKSEYVNEEIHEVNSSAHTEESSAEKMEENSIAKKLLSLYNLQKICSKIDDIRVIRGELPNEVSDLEDTVEGMKTRIENFNEAIANLQAKSLEQDIKIKEANALINRYQEQQNNVRNNREYESLTKEIQFQGLEIQLAEKNKGKIANEIVDKTEEISRCEALLKETEEVLHQKKFELDDIIADTEKEEAELNAQAEVLKKDVEERLLVAFERIRKNARNGLAIVKIERDACGGCFSTIPPQRQLDIRLHKKIIVCEACGRIFIDQQLVESQEEDLN